MIAETAADNAGVRQQNYYSKAVKRFFHHKLGVIGFVVLTLVFLAGIFAPAVSPYDPTQVDVKNIRSAPTAEHWFGTDELGRDILSRVIFGTRVTLMVMVISVSLALVGGTLLGLIAGYAGGKVEAVLMMIMDALLSFPMLILALAIIAILGPGIQNAMMAIAIVNVPNFARIVRGQVLAIKQSEYIDASRSIGSNGAQVLFKEILPNTLDAIIIYASLRSSQAIITESSLSFLGLGVQPPTPSWGWMVAVGMKFWNVAWWMSFFPGLAIFITVLSVNLVGDALRDAFDSQLRM
ncbi:MAG TPA: ABC transporter permease [Bellilinea sp.]|nr:ABC transporter permease [Bellilinea sp.]